MRKLDAKAVNLFQNYPYFWDLQTATTKTLRAKKKLKCAASYTLFRPACFVV